MTKFDQARRSSDPMAALELLDLMEAWSEDRLCAGWIHNLARHVDDMVGGQYIVGDGFHEIDQVDIDAMKRTRAACGGTWVFDGDVVGWRRFVTDAEWDAMGRTEEKAEAGRG